MQLFQPQGWTLFPLPIVLRIKFSKKSDFMIKKNQVNKINCWYIFYVFSISPGQFSAANKKIQIQKTIQERTEPSSCKNTLMKSPILEACAYGQLETIEHLLKVNLFELFQILRRCLKKKSLQYFHLYEETESLPKISNKMLACLG